MALWIHQWSFESFSGVRRDYIDLFRLLTFFHDPLYCQPHKWVRWRCGGIEHPAPWEGPMWHGPSGSNLTLVTSVLRPLILPPCNAKMIGSCPPLVKRPMERMLGNNNVINMSIWKRSFFLILETTAHLLLLLYPAKDVLSVFLACLWKSFPAIEITSSVRYLKNRILWRYRGVDSPLRDQMLPESPLLICPYLLSSFVASSWELEHRKFH